MRCHHFVTLFKYFGMTLSLKFCILLLNLLQAIVMDQCGRAEYLIGKECCPVCEPGYYVKIDCTEYKSTTCDKCPPSTFTDKHNGLRKCFSCSVCDPSVGLRVRKACSSTSDALCEPLQHYYCTDPIKGGCQGAKEHTKCLPGQYINQTGTASADTVCVDCTGDTYSNGSFTSCKPHTQCESLGLFLKKPGSTTTDVECEAGRQRLSGIWMTTGCIILFLLVLSVWRHNRRRNSK